jgi:hypothetical protein
MKRGFQEPDAQRNDSTGKAQARLRASRQGSEDFQFHDETAMAGVSLEGSLFRDVRHPVRSNEP